MSQHPGEFAADRPVTVDEAASALNGALAVGPRKALLSKTSLRRALLAAGGAAALAAIGYFGWQYWTVGRFEVSTDDAYVQADTTTIAPKISGYVAEVLVGDNQPVKAGETLAKIDDRDFRVALDQAKADVAAASAAILTKAGFARSAAVRDRSRSRGDPGRSRPTPHSRTRTTSATRPSPPPATAACKTPRPRRPARPPRAPRSREIRPGWKQRAGKSTC